MSKHSWGLKLVTANPTCTCSEAALAMAASGEKAELMGLLAERMQGIAEQAAAVAERTQRAAQLAVRARECAELYGGM